jgi:hypothetical protein
MSKEAGSLIQRLGSIIRHAAAECSSKVAGPRKWIKGEGHFLSRISGKKPVPGLYLDDELKFLIQQWELKNEQVKESYKKIPNRWDQIISSKGDKLGMIMSYFQIKSDPLIKLIEDNARSRIPYLLIQTGRGKNRTSSIVKGSTLTDKIAAMDCEDPRTIVRLMYTPLQKFTTTTFTDLTIRLVRARLFKSETNFYKQQEQLCQDDKVYSRIYNDSMVYVVAAAEFVLSQNTEIKQKIPAWTAMLSR